MKKRSCLCVVTFQTSEACLPEWRELLLLCGTAVPYWYQKTRISQITVRYLKHTFILFTIFLFLYYIYILVLNKSFPLTANMNFGKKSYHNKINYKYEQKVGGAVDVSLSPRKFKNLTLLTTYRAFV